MVPAPSSSLPAASSRRRATGCTGATAPPTTFTVKVSATAPAPGAMRTEPVDDCGEADVPQAAAPLAAPLLPAEPADTGAAEGARRRSAVAVTATAAGATPAKHATPARASGSAADASTDARLTPVPVTTKVSETVTAAAAPVAPALRDDERVDVGCAGPDGPTVCVAVAVPVAETGLGLLVGCSDGDVLDDGSALTLGLLLDVAEDVRDDDDAGVRLTGDGEDVAARLREGEVVAP